MKDNRPGRTLVLRNSDANAQLPTSSTCEAQNNMMLPRVKLHNQNPKRVDILTNRLVNNPARNNYEQFLSK